VTGDRIKETRMDIERLFAAAVFNAERDAAKAGKHGHQTMASDLVTAALIDLWGRGAADGLTSKQLDEIADRYVVYDPDGKPWPKPFDRDNVVALRGTRGRFS
jgi:hypothetical protein